MELIFFVGIPASGKSTLANQYREQGYQVLSSDEIRSLQILRRSIDARKKTADPHAGL